MPDKLIGFISTLHKPSTAEKSDRNSPSKTEDRPDIIG